MICEKCGSSQVRKLHTVPWRGIKFYMYQCENCGAKMTSRMYGRGEKEDNAPVTDSRSGGNFWTGCAFGVLIGVLAMAAFFVTYPLLAVRFR